MHPRKWLRAIAISSSVALCLCAQEEAKIPAGDTQPGQTVNVPAHASRWTYPRQVVLPVDSQMHVVSKGDTLWDLGQKYLGNPFAWPQIWELNKWVVDPHWIYPGDNLVIPVGRQTIGSQGQVSGVPDEVRGAAPGRRFATKPVVEEYAFTFTDFISMPFVASQGAGAYLKASNALAIRGRRNEDHTILGAGEVIYLDGGAQKGLRVGDRLLVLKQALTGLYHPDDPRQKKSLGDVLLQAGVVRVTSVNADSSVAIIERSTDGIEHGDAVVRFVEPGNIPLRLRTDVAEPVPVQANPPKVIYINGNHGATAGGEMMIVDQGSRQGLKVGDVLLATRSYSWLSSGVWDKEAGPSITNHYLGQAMVVKVMEGTATCRLLRTNSELMVGDILTR